jgi:branched-chain amino acid transport system permease protein
VTTVLLFAVLGLGSGAAYALLALGVVVVQRGSGTVNFAQGAIAMIGAFGFNELVGNGLPTYLALAVVLCGVALFGAAWHLLVMRQLRRAPVIAKIIATLALLAALQGLALLRYGTGIRTGVSILPSGSIRVFGVAFGQDRLYLLGIAIVATVALWALYRYTLFGIATRAATESERGATLLGFSPDVIACVNWATGCVLGALAGILVAPIIGLDISVLTLLILPALSASLLGRFHSFLLTAAAGIAIGIAQSEITQYWAQQGVSDALPFVVVIVAMVITGQLIPERGSLGGDRAPLALSNGIRWYTWLALGAGSLITLFAVDDVYKSALVTSVIAVVAGLSVVVVTGFVGQTSLMPMTFAGIGGLLTSKFAQELGLPFPVPLLLAAVCAVPIGVVLGLPALRVRGLNLAVVTIGAAVAVSSVLFANASYTGGLVGSLVPAPALFGWSLSPSAEPDRFGLMCLIVAGALLWAVDNLRRSPLGLRMLAVRSNERAAAMSSIGVPATKLQAFALSAAIAAVAGSLLSYQIGAVSFDRFDVFGSIALITLVYIGGVSVATGAVFAGLIVNGGIGFLLLQDAIPPLSEYYTLISGLLLLVTVVANPDGIVVANRRLLHAARAKAGGRIQESPPVSVDPPGLPVTSK